MTPAFDSPHVVVVGGGIVGLSAAYYLAERGVEVTVFERNAIAAGSTGRSAGGIRSQYATQVNVELSLASKRVWDQFEATFGVDIQHRKSGYLFLARSETAAERFEHNVDLQQQLGAETELLTPVEASAYCEGLDPDPFVAATYNPDDGFADPNLAAQGFARGARAAGVDIETGVAVTDIERDGDRVTGVQTDGDDTVSADFVVNAAGPSARHVGQLADVDLPIYPRRRQVAVVEPARPVPETDPLTIDLERGSYFRPERDGAAITGGHFADEDPDVDPKGYDQSMDLDWAATAVERAGAYADYFGPDTRIKRGWAGLYAVTPDHHPIIEEVCPGFITAAGFSGHGFQHAPATGQLVAEFVCDGGPSLVDVSMLTADRFDTGDEIVEQNVV